MSQIRKFENGFRLKINESDTFNFEFRLRTKNKTLLLCFMPLMFLFLTKILTHGYMTFTQILLMYEFLYR